MSMHLDRVLHAAAQRSEAAPGLLEALVRVNSHTRNAEGCDAVARALRDALAVPGLRCTEHPAHGFGRHLVFRTAASHTRAPILLVGHHDTVFPKGTFEGYRETDGVAYGPGVLDMKGGLVVIASALLSLQDAGLLASMPLCFACVSDEEVGSPSSQGLLRMLAGEARVGLVFEAGRPGDAIVTARRGAGHAVLAAHGRAAHAGNARAEGASAILALARAIDALERLNDTLEDASVSVGLVQGGSARNTVPASARAEVDMRFASATTQAALIGALDDAALGAARSVPGTRIETTTQITRAPWVETPQNAGLAARYGQCQMEAGLLPGGPLSAGGGSDGNTLAQAGLSVIDGLGPRGTGFHTHEERMELSSLGMKTESLLRFLLRELAADSQG
jgi:glutamate carboxypeptidase